MANKVSTYTPQFVVYYVVNQFIISSDRVMLHSNNDSIFLFGKQSISLSAIDTINLDALSGVIVESPKVLLGSHTANQSAILGNKHLEALISFLDSISTICVSLQSVSAGTKPPTPELANAMLKIATFGKQLSGYCLTLKNQLPASLSKTTFTT